MKKNIAIFSLIFFALVLFLIGAGTVAAEEPAHSAAASEPVFIVELFESENPRTDERPIAGQVKEFPWTNFNSETISPLTFFEQKCDGKGKAIDDNKCIYLLGNESMHFSVKYKDTKGNDQKMPLFKVGTNVQKGGKDIDWTSPSKKNDTYFSFMLLSEGESKKFYKTVDIPNLLYERFYAIGDKSEAFCYSEIGKFKEEIEETEQIPSKYKTWKVKGEDGIYTILGERICDVASKCTNPKKRFDCIETITFFLKKQYLYDFTEEGEFPFLKLDTEFDTDWKDELIIHRITLTNTFLEHLKSFILQTGKKEVKPVVPVQPVCTELPKCLALMAKKAFIDTGLLSEPLLAEKEQTPKK